MKIKSIYMYEIIMLISSIITCCLFYIVLKTCLGIMLENPLKVVPLIHSNLTPC